MAAWVCSDCTTTYSVGAPRCPHCHATAYTVQGDPMPKITVAGGASSRHDLETAGAVTEPPASTAPAPETADASSPEQDYEAWTVEQLKEQLGVRGLARSGKRNDLVQRLRDDDARATAPELE